MNKSFIIASTALLIIGIVLYLWIPANHALFHLINTALPNKLLWTTITTCGEVVFAGCLIFIVLRNNNRLLVNSLLAALVAHYSVKYLKILFAELRPEHTENIQDLFTLGPALDINNYGMPSGHTTTAFMVATIIICGCSLKNAKLWLVLFAAILIGISRMAVGVHWPCDVFAGAGLGILIGLLFSHKDLNLQHKFFGYLTMALYLPFFAYALLRITQIHSATTALNQGIVVLAGFLGLIIWLRKVYAEIKSPGKIQNESAAKK